MAEGSESLRSAVFGLALVVVALLACAGPESMNAKLRADLTRRARFDLNCPNGIETTPLQKDGEWVRSYGVLGCGKRATYVLTPDMVWVMNSGPDGKVNVDPSLTQPPPPAPMPPAPMPPPAPR